MSQELRRAMTVVDELVACHAAAVSAGRSPHRWTFAPQTYCRVVQECRDLILDPGCPDATPWTFLGIPVAIGDAGMNEPYRLD